MNQIPFPLKEKDKGNDVKNLQEAMIALAGRINLSAFQNLLKDPDFRKGLNDEIQKQFFGVATKKVIVLFQRAYMQTDPTGLVDEATAGAVNQLLARYGLIEMEENDQYLVYGTVRDQSLLPLAKTTVKAFDKDIRSEQQIGETRTDTKGNYRIPYDVSKFQQEDKANADLILRVYDASGKILKSTIPLYNAPVQVQIDISLADVNFQGLSEFEDRKTEFATYIGELAVYQLNENQKLQDISFLVKKTNLAEDEIIDFAMAFRYEKNTKLDAAVYYGMLRKGLPGGMFFQISDQAPTQLDLDQKSQQTFAALMLIDVSLMMNAVRQSIAENLIPYLYQAQLDSIQKQLQQIISDYTKTNPSGSTSNLLDLAGLTPKQQQSFQDVFTLGQGTGSGFWTNLQQQKTFQDAPLGKAQAIFQLAAVTQNQLPLITSLTKTENIQSAADVTKLAAFSEQDWINYLKKNKIASPSIDISINAYAGQLASAFEKTFPTTAFAARLANDTAASLPQKDAVSKFLIANPNFDLVNSTVGNFIKPSTDTKALSDQLKKLQRVFKLAPTYAAASTLLKDNIHSSQQIYFKGKSNFLATYTPSLGAAEATLVYQRAQLQYAGALMMAGEFKSLASAGNMNALPDYKGTLQNSPLASAYPDLQTLFGQADFCECEECRSVLGAAAYLTDVLHFLSERMSLTPGTSAKSMVLGRRPDIGDIDLNCANTNTLVPYIDIVNEILEDYISPPLFTINLSFLPKIKKGTIDPALLQELLSNPGNTALSTISLLSPTALLSDVFITSEYGINQWIIRDSFITLKLSQQSAAIEVKLLHQTHLSSDEISANPECTNVKTYALLAAAQRPFTLPFDLFEKEGDLYLQKLGVEKTNLIDIFRKAHETPSSPSNNFTDTDYQVAYAYFKVNHAEEGLIFKADPLNQNKYWGNLATVNEVDLFENASGLAYTDLLTLLSLPFINPLVDSVIVSDDLSCDTNTKHISNLANDKLDRIHRFLRLLKKTTVSMQQLDACIGATAVGKGNLDANFIVRLQHVMQLSSSLSLSIEQVLCFYQNLDPDTYTGLFLNKSITNPLNPDFALAVVTSGASPAMSDTDSAVILAVLGISTEELNALTAKTDGKLSLDNLSFFCRNAFLAQALSLTVTELLTAFDLINGTPFADPVSTDTFLSQYTTISTSGFSIDELNYLLRQQDAEGAFIPDDPTVIAGLQSIRTGLQLIRAATDPLPDPKGAVLGKWLSDALLNWDHSIATKLLDILLTTDDTEYQQKLTDNEAFLIKLRIVYAAPSCSVNLYTLPSVSFPANSQSQISYNTDKKTLTFAGYMSSADEADLLLLSGDTDFQNAIKQLFLLSQQSDSAVSNTFFASHADVVANLGALDSSHIPQRFALFLTDISPVYRQLLQNGFVQREISTLFKVDKKLALVIFTSISGIYSDFSADAFVNTNMSISVLNFPAQYKRFLLISKISFVIGKLKITAEDLGWLVKNAGPISSLDFLALPVQPITGPVAAFSSFETLINLYKFIGLYPVVPPPFSGTILTIPGTSVFTLLQDVLDGKTVALIESDLVALTRWSKTDVDYALGAANPFQLTLPGDLKDIHILVRLHRIFIAAKQLGVPLAKAIQWTGDQLTYQDSQDIKQALKAGYEDSQWLSVTQPIQDQLRDTKRDALVTYLLTNPGTQTWTTENDLHSFFLVDVEMSHCQPSSRIVQANGALQLFVQRVMMNLEANIVADATVDEDWLQWKWMQQYRLWEANRMVFLFPENYIEPELRLVKSSFFKDLENDLQQNEVTKDTAESAFMSYLEKLDGVARLEIKGMWNQDETDTLHVFARTYGGDPKLWYYRTFIGNRRWTPWEKVDLDIKSDHIVPIVFNNRIYLFWPVFTEKSDDVDSIAIPHAGDNYSVQKPTKYWQVQMAFSEFRNGKWSPKKVSEDFIDHVYFSPTGDYSHPIFPDKPDFVFIPVDLPDVEALLVSVDTKGGSFIDTLLQDLQLNNSIQINCYIYNATSKYYSFRGTFELDPCRGYPALAPNNFLKPAIRLFDRSGWQNQLDVETDYYDVPGSDALSVNNGVILRDTPNVFRNLLPLQMDFFDKLVYVMYWLLLNKNQTGFNSDRGIPITLGTFMPFFYQDKKRTFFVTPEFTDDGDFEFFYSNLETLFIAILEKDTTKVQEILATIPKNTPIRLLNRFFNFYHPFTCFFMRQLFSKGIEGFMSRETQLKGDPAYTTEPVFDFNPPYGPNPLAVYSGKPITYPNGFIDNTPGYPREQVDFDLRSGYAFYNWELFFHAPLMIAERLSQNQQFDEATRWFNFIFNPTDASGAPSPQKYWMTKPFFSTTATDYLKERIENIMLLINSDPDPGEKKQLEADVADWRTNPFQPHNIAEYRTVAYQKTVVMKYLDHLIAWGDYLFTQDTMESVNQATQLYLLAGEILGPKPQIIPAAYATPDQNFYQMENNLDAFSNALVEIENLLPLQEIKGYDGVSPTDPKLPRLETLYFCIPANSQLMAYWDTVADRLFKIRHCLNIAGVYAPLALFAPPINPALLVRATAAGLDIGSILADLNAPLPTYRFSVMLQKAVDLCNEVKSLGASLLAALEKKDAESMALLQSGQQITLLNAVRKVKTKQVDDANSSLTALNKTKEQAQLKINYYSKLINEGLNTGEITALALNATATGIDAAIAIGYALSGGLKLIPAFTIGAAGFGGSPTANAEMGGNTFGNSAEDAVKTMESIAGALEKGAALANTLAGYDRRKVEWQQQLDLANKDLEQVTQQIVGGQIKVDIATQDLSNQDLQIDNAGKTDDFLKSKFTNAELYNYLINQISTVYFEGYQLAYAVAKKAEQCYRYELGLNDSSFINFGYWDSLRKGLISGEKLMYDIHQLEIGYFEQNKREYELTKHISLAQIDPVALLLLKENGDCWVNLPEELFDMDYPGHYMRRIKSVSFSIPAIAGPYTTVSCTLALTKNSLRIQDTATGSGTYPRKKNSAKLPADDNRFRDNVSSIQSLAISNAQNDSGLFELNFKDERYLPFEGAGAISTWHIQLPTKFKQYDYASITDLIIHLKYTARDGGDALRSDAQDSLQNTLVDMLTSPGHTGLYRIFSASHDFPTEWYNFLNPAVAGKDQVMKLDFTNRFPYFSQGKTIKIKKVELLADSMLPAVNALNITNPTGSNLIDLTSDGVFGSFLHGVQDYGSAKKDSGVWEIINQVANPVLKEDKMKDLFIILYFEAK
jgi:hypothetical protein